MSPSNAFTGMVAGIALAFGVLVGGFGGFLLVACLGGAGLAAGLWLDEPGRVAALRDALGRRPR
ncbi:hypothetical protein [Actinomadura flavalba]|uniref:hypothetical protein n=1 Tax=Actinomadura flavalba TaxID=1120938 RepID=UPI000381D030|nr:hypothetical protein [Actinomadura flavalba]